VGIDKLLALYPNPNILIIITDQERAVAEWPESYRAILEESLPAMAALKKNGLSFDHAYTAACMCSPSRATFQTSQYPIVTGCTTTGTAVLPLPSSFPNITSVLAASGYNCYWIGKWHLLGADEPGSGDSDLLQWGYQPYPPSPGRIASIPLAWDPPDAGITLDATYLGGGTQGPTATNQNDQRYVADAISFLNNPPASGPWCLVVSLVNPHDVHLGYEGQDSTYYDSSLYQNLNVPLPHDIGESLADMPRGQAFFTWSSRASSGASQGDFANFYAYLMSYVDGQVGSILDVMSADLKNQTLIIRFSDHGEMGLAHGLIEKFVNAYGQCMHVPLVFSNPIAWPDGVRTEALASTVDLAPSLVGLLGPSGGFPSFVGTDLMPVLKDHRQSVQDHVHYTYDDITFDNVADVGVPSIIRTIRSKDWVYSVYLDMVCSHKSGYSDADWEMYDLRNDPQERWNLAGKPEHAKEQARLDLELQRQMIAKGTAPAWFHHHWPPQATANSRGGPPPSDTGNLNHSVADVPGISQSHADSLRYVGIRTTAQLLARGSTAEGRKKLAGLVAIEEAVLKNWLAAAEAMGAG
jgi:choline-sulfatase